MISQVSDLTSLDVGKRLRIQTDDGAYIEGTLTKITHVLPHRATAVVQTLVEFRELYLLAENREQVPYVFVTWGNRSAIEVEE